MKIGRRLAIKLLNASKFSLGRLADGPVPGPAAVTEPIDHALLARLADVVTESTVAFEEFDYAGPRSLPRRSSGRFATITSSS